MKNLYIDVKNQSTGGGTVISDEWVRPDDWLALPVLAEGDQKFVGLHAVYGDSDFVSVLCAGNYTVDWGDGTVENVAANTKRDHLFSYAALAGTECSRGYRQAIVTITPQDGQRLTLINLQQRHSQPVLSVYRSGWLDIEIVSSNLNSLVTGGSTVINSMVEQIRYVGTNQLTSMANMFFNFYSLQSVPEFYTSLSNTFQSTFQTCYALKRGPMLDTSNGTNFSSMYSTCTGLLSIPHYNTSKGTNFSNMLYNCYALMELPPLDTSSGTNFFYMLYACFSITVIPLLDLSLATNTSRMLYGCSNLNTLPAFNLALATTVDYMLNNCYSLQRARFVNISSSFSITSCRFSAYEIEQLFNGLSAVSSATLTITGNWGAAYLTDTQKAIATNKGWTLVL